MGELEITGAAINPDYTHLAVVGEYRDTTKNGLNLDEYTGTGENVLRIYRVSKGVGALTSLHEFSLGIRGYCSVIYDEYKNAFVVCCAEENTTLSWHFNIDRPQKHTGGSTIYRYDIKEGGFTRLGQYGYFLELAGRGFDKIYNVFYYPFPGARYLGLIDKTTLVIKPYVCTGDFIFPEVYHPPNMGLPASLSFYLIIPNNGYYTAPYRDYLFRAGNTVIAVTQPIERNENRVVTYVGDDILQPVIYSWYHNSLIYVKRLTQPKDAFRVEMLSLTNGSKVVLYLKQEQDTEYRLLPVAY